VADDPERERGPYENEIGEALYQTRMLTIAALARRCSIDRPTLSRIVNGWALPSAEQLDAIAVATGWAPSRLYPREEFRLAIEATRQVVAS
jgi:transcriptional regulator with XRE-family HTH domain